MNIEKFKQNFKAVFPKKRLLAVRLNGFSHSAWYDDGTPKSAVEQLWYSACAPESPHNTTISKQLLGIYPHYCYQNNPFGHVYVAPDNR